MTSFTIAYNGMPAEGGWYIAAYVDFFYFRNQWLFRWNFSLLSGLLSGP
jgi:hypothetical protein